jgi:hypothetical protein
VVVAMGKEFGGTKIVELVRDSATAQARFRDTAVHQDDEHHMRLLEVVERVLIEARKS